MGLDMYLYRAKKANVEPGKFYKREELGENIAIFSRSLKEAMESEETKELVDFLTPVNLEVTLIDKEKIEKDYQVSLEYVCYRSSDELGFRCKNQDSPLMIATELLLRKYSYTEIKEHTVAEIERIAYWRKEYALQDRFYSLFPDCGDLNTTYKKVSASDLKSIGACDDVEETDDSGLFYYEWY